MTNLSLYFRFDLERLVRSWKFLAVTVGFPVIFYILFLGDNPANRMVGGSLTWRAYLMVSMCSFGALVAALNAGGTRICGERTSGWARQMRVTPLPSWSYVATKTAASMAVVLPVIVLVEAVGAGFGGVSQTPAVWVELALVLWVASIPFAVLGVFVGFMVSAETAYPVITVLMFVLGWFGGLFNPVAWMPGSLQVVAQLLPSYHNAALGMDLLGDSAMSATNWLVLAAYTVVLGGVVVWRHRVEESKGLA